MLDVFLALNEHLVNLCLIPLKIFLAISARFYRENEYNQLGVLSEPDNLNYHDRCENFLD